MKEPKQNFSKLIAAIANSDVISRDALLEKLDENQLHDAGIIDKGQFHKRKSVINTRNT